MSRFAYAKMDFRVVMRHRDWALLNEVIARAEKKWGECSWLGIGKMKDGSMLINKVVYPEQVNTRGETDMPSDKLSTVLATECVDGNMVLWWGHSHGQMSTFYSGTDEATWKNWTAGNPEFFLGTCHNAKGEVFTRVRVGHLNVEIDEFPLLTLDDPLAEELVEAAMSKMAAPVYKAPAYHPAWDHGGDGVGAWQNGSGYGAAKKIGERFLTSGVCLLLDTLVTNRPSHGSTVFYAADASNPVGWRLDKENPHRQPTSEIRFYNEVKAPTKMKKWDWMRVASLTPQNGGCELLAAAFIGSYREIMRGDVENCTMADICKKADSLAESSQFWKAANHLLIHFAGKWSTLTNAGRCILIGATLEEADKVSNLTEYVQDDDTLLWMMLEALEGSMGTGEKVIEPCWLDLDTIRCMQAVEGGNDNDDLAGGLLILPKGVQDGSEGAPV